MTSLDLTFTTTTKSEEHIRLEKRTSQLFSSRGITFQRRSKAVARERRQTSSNNTNTTNGGMPVSSRAVSLVAHKTIDFFDVAAETMQRTTTTVSCTPAAFLRSLETPCAYTAMKATTTTTTTREKRRGGGGLEVERIDAHAKRMFTTLSAEKQSGIFENDWNACKEVLEQITKALLAGAKEEENEGQDHMVTIAIEDDGNAASVKAHGLLTPLGLRKRKSDEKKGEKEEVVLYALLRGAPRERPHAKHTDWVRKREGLEIERNEWNAREEGSGGEKKRKKFVECVLCKRVGSSLPAESKEEDFLLCEGLTTNVFVLKRDTNSGGLVLQTAPDADVLLGVARRAILDAFPSKADDVEDKGKDSPKNRIRLSLSHPLWSDRASWIALFTVNCVVGATSYHGIVNAYTGEELTFPPLPKEDDDNEEEEEEEEEESERTRGLASLFRSAFSSSPPPSSSSSPSSSSPFPFDVFE